MVVDQHVARAVHRLHRVVALLRLGEEHVLLVVVPVAGFLPQLDVEDRRAAHLPITRFAIHLAHVALDRLPDRPAARMPEHHARRFLLLVEQVERLADLAVIALLGLLDAPDVRVELLGIRPGSAVDALQLFVFRVAAPVRAGNARQLERLQETRVRHVRAAAHVDVFFVVVQAHLLLVGHVVDEAKLVVLATRAEHLDDLGARRHLLDDVVFLVDQFAHALLDRGEIVRRERAFVPDVVIEPVLDDRSDHHLRIREQLLDRVTDEVRGRMANDLDAFRILRRDDAERCVVVDAIAGIDEPTIDLARDRRLRESRADRRGHFLHARCAVE